eukprot:scaffold12369_cov97-Cylindrotheca_fusiformis.AAC.6
MNFSNNQFPDMLPLQAPMELPHEPEFETSPHKPVEDITVFVSGSTFCIVPSLFRKVRGLAWYDMGGVPHLDESADLFEVILQFFLFGCLPSKSMIKHHKVELMRMVSMLRDADELVACVQNDGKKKKKKKSMSNPMNYYMKPKNSLFVQTTTPGLSVRNTNREASSSSLSSKKSSGMSSFFSKKSKSSCTVTTANTMMTNEEQDDDFPPIVRSVAFDDANSTVASQIASSDISTISSSSSGSGAISSNQQENSMPQKAVFFAYKKGVRGMTHEECCGSEFIV